MPSTFPQCEGDRDDLDEEARLEGPTAVSTPVRNAPSSPSTSVKNLEKDKIESSPHAPVQDAAGQPVATKTSPPQEPIIVSFNQPYDSENPYQWSRFKKIRIAVLVLSYALVSGIVAKCLQTGKQYLRLTN